MDTAWIAIGGNKGDGRTAVALASANYALLIADYADVGMLKRHLAGTVSPPAILPILLESDQAAEARVQNEFHCLIKPRTMRPNDALAEIDHAIDARLKSLKRETE